VTIVDYLGNTIELIGSRWITAEHRSMRT